MRSLLLWLSLLLVPAAACAACAAAGEAGRSAPAVAAAGAPTASAPASVAPVLDTGRLVVEFLDVGQGDAALITSPTGKRVLVDGGPPEAGPRLAAALARRGVRALDLVVLTHPHTDHAGGLRAAFRQAPPRLFLDPGIAHTAPAYHALLADLERRQVPVKDARAGRVVELGGGAKLEVLWPPAAPPAHLDLNNRSVVLRVSHGDVAFLLMADAEARVEALLLRGDSSRLRARVLKVGHHGSRNASSTRFLGAVGATEAVISVGAGNDYGHPTAAALSRLASSGATIRRTDRDGTVGFVTDGHGLSVRAAPEAGTMQVKGTRRRR